MEQNRHISFCSLAEGGNISAIYYMNLGENNRTPLLLHGIALNIFFGFCNDEILLGAKIQNLSSGTEVKAWGEFFCRLTEIYLVTLELFLNSCGGNRICYIGNEK